MISTYLLLKLLEQPPDSLVNPIQSTVRSTLFMPLLLAFAVSMRVTFGLCRSVNLIVHIILSAGSLLSRIVIIRAVTSNRP